MNLETKTMAELVVVYNTLTNKSATLKTFNSKAKIIAAINAVPKKSEVKPMKPEVYESAELKAYFTKIVNDSHYVDEAGLESHFTKMLNDMYEIDEAGLESHFTKMLNDMYEIDEAGLEARLSEIPKAKAPANKPGPKQGVGSFVYSFFQQGNFDQAAILEAVKAAFPSAKTSKGCIAWYKTKFLEVKTNQ